MESSQLADLLLRAARRMRHGQADALAPLGLTPSQARALRVVLRSDDPPRMTDLAGRLGIVPRSATGLVDALEEAGLVERRQDPANRRVLLVVPTARAHEARTRMREARTAAAEALFAPLDDAERRVLGALLSRLES